MSLIINENLARMSIFLMSGLLKTFPTLSMLMLMQKNTVKYSYICGPSRIYSKIRNKEGMIIADLDKRKIIGLRRHYGLV